MCITDLFQLLTLLANRWHILKKKVYLLQHWLETVMIRPVTWEELTILLLSRHQSMHSTLFPCPFKVLRVFMTNWPRASIFSATWCTAVRKTNLHEPHDHLKSLKLNQNWKHISASRRWNMIDDELYYIWTDIWLYQTAIF